MAQERKMEDDLEELKKAGREAVINAGKGLGRAFISLGNVLTGRELTRDSELLERLKRREAFLTEARRKGMPRVVAEAKWFASEYERKNGGARTAGKKPPEGAA